MACIYSAAPFSDEANVETHGFDPALVNNHLNPACSPLWLNAIVGELVKGRDCSAVRDSLLGATVTLLSQCASFCVDMLFSTVIVSPAWISFVAQAADPKPFGCADRGMRMFERDKNHASILLWSLGNESGERGIYRFPV